MRKIFLLFCACAFALNSWAFDIEYNGLYFKKLSDTELELIKDNSYYEDAFCQNTFPNGAVTIVSPFTVNSVEYTVTSIGRDAFMGVSNLTSIVIPSSVTKIDDYAFFLCDKLESITLTSVISIGKSAFAACEKLTSANLGNSLISIGESAFSGCSNLEEVVIPNTIMDIESEAFSDCSNINYYTDGNGKYLGNETNPNLVLADVSWDATSLMVKDGCKIIGGNAADFTYDLTSVTMPSSVISICREAFYCCTSLTEISIPENVTTIGMNAFRSCGLSSVKIPNSVTSVGGCAFYGCSSEMVILCEWTEDTKPNLPSDWKDETAKVVWNYNNKTVDATAVGAAGGGSVTVEPSGPYEYGQTVTLTATPNTDFMFVGWSDGNRDNPRTIVVQDNDNKYEATFYSTDADICEIMVTVNGKGSVTGDGYYLKGVDVKLTATPSNAIYHFVGWSDGWSNGNIINPRTFKATENVNLTAIFEGQPVTIGETTVSAIGRMTDNAVFRPTITGRYTFSVSSQNQRTYACLIDSVGMTVLVERNNGYNNQFTYNLEADKTYYIGASFQDEGVNGNVTLTISEPIMVVTATTLCNGTVRGSGSYDYNTSAELIAEPAEGYHFVKWEDDDNAGSNRTIEHVTQSATYVAVFAINEYNITATGYTNGTIEGAKKYTHGQTVTLTAKPVEGYHFEGWGDENNNNPRIFTATKDTAFTPLFAINTYTLTATGAHGSFEGIEASYNHGATASITAKPDDGNK